MKKLILFILLSVISMVCYAGLKVTTINDESGNLTSTATLSKRDLTSLGNGFLAVDSSTVTYFGYQDGLTYWGTTSLTGTGSGDTAWTLSGTDTTSSETINFGTLKNISARSFDGSTKFLTNDNSSFNPLPSGSDWTVECILKFNSTSPSDYRAWGNLPTGAPFFGAEIYMDSTNINLRTFNNSVNQDASFAHSGITTSNWYHLVVTFDASEDDMRIGMNADSTGLVTNLSSGNVDFYGENLSLTHDFSASGFGAMRVGRSLNSYFAGKIAEIRISNIKRY